MGLLNAFRSKKAVVITMIVAMALLVIQFFGPTVSYPPVTSEFEGPPEVKHILERSCYNCHSNQTRLQWFDKVAPASWIVALDVTNARNAMNFSAWNDMTEPEKRSKIWHVVNMLVAGQMPLKSYKALHPSVIVSDAELDILKEYAKASSYQKPGDTARQSHADREFLSWSMSPLSAVTTKSTSLNGISYFNDYKNWKVISTSASNVDVTIRVVYGNTIAAKAIETNNIRPWPKGSMIVKVVWDQLEDSLGQVRPGAFSNVQIMIKNDKLYPATEGWGFAKFFGLDLVPAGKTASYDLACMSCHQLAKDKGFVFNVPPKVK